MQLTALIAAVTCLAAPAQPAKTVSVPLRGATGQSVGEATLTAAKKGVKIYLKVKGLTPGEHALHFHQTGTCTGPDFKSAGDHFAVDHKAHGKVEGGPHEGDMPNFTVGNDGKGKAELVNEHVTLTGGPRSLLKPAGTALVIHAKADDYKTQPAGDAGDRIACGVIPQ